MRERLAPLLALLAPLVPAMAAGPLAAQDVFTRITDLRPGTQNGLLGLDAVVWNGALYFVAQDDASGFDLWRYDGVNVPTLVAGSSGSNPEELVVHDGALYFRGGPAGDRELWRYDGLVAPLEALDIFAGAHSGPAWLTSFGDLLCFSGTTAAGGELMCWDGLTAPTVFDIRPGPEWSEPAELAVRFGELYFRAYEPVAGSDPRIYSGVGQPTVLDVVPGDGSSSPERFTAAGTDLFFIGYPEGQGRLYRRQPALPPVLVEPTLDIEGGLGSFTGALYVAGHTDDNPTPQLFRFDAVAIELLTRLQPSVALADSFLTVGGALYFVGGTFAPFTDLYRHCAGSESIELVSTLFADDDHFVNHGLVAFNGRIYFAADEELTTGRELWALDPLEPIFCSGFLGGSAGGWSAIVP